MLLRLALLLFIPGAACAQAPVALTGTVQETATKTAIPYAVVELPTRHLGVQADQEGRFSLPLPPDLTPTDSLTVSALGYRRRRVAVADAARVTLEALPLALQEVVVRGTWAAPVVLGPREKAGRGGGFGQNGLTADKHTGWQVARFFAQPPTGQLTAVRFYVKPGRAACARQLVQAPFRVRVYAADGPAGAPGTDLLTQTVLAAVVKPGWLTVDLAAFSLPTPAAGFFVAMEWLYTDDRYFCQTAELNPITKARTVATHYGQTLGGYWRPQDLGTTWYLATGYPWQKMRPLALPGKPPQFDEPAIQAIIQP